MLNCCSKGKSFRHFLHLSISVYVTFFDSSNSPTKEKEKEKNCKKKMGYSLNLNKYLKKY